MKTRTVKEWINKLNPKIRRKCKVNFINYNTDENGVFTGNFNELYYEFSDFIYLAFVWDDSPEGFEYWEDIYEEAKDIEKGYKPDINEVEQKNKT